MGQIRVGHFEADGNDHNLELGFVPDYIKIWNAMAAVNEVFCVEWFGGEMTDNYAIRQEVLADNGATGHLSIDYLGSMFAAAYNSKVVGNRKGCTFDDTGGVMADLITCTEAEGHGLSVGDKVMFVASGGLPTNYNQITQYWVITTSTPTTFQVSTTQDGSAADMGSDGTPPNYFFSVSDMVVTGAKGVTITASGFMADGDEIWYLAIKADRAVDHGDIA